MTHHVDVQGNSCTAKEEIPPCMKPLKIYQRQSWRWTRRNKEANSCACLKLYQAVSRELPLPLALVCTTVMRTWAAVQLQLQHFTPSAGPAVRASSSSPLKFTPAALHTPQWIHRMTETKENKLQVYTKPDRQIPAQNCPDFMKEQN